MNDRPAVQQSFAPLTARLHTFDFERVLPWLGRLPKWLGEPLAALRGEVRAWAQADWRSIALGHRHIGPRSQAALRELAPDAPARQVRAWLRERFLAEARDEFEARWLAEGRCDDLECRFVPARGERVLLGRDRGLVLLTAHHDSFVLGIRLLALSGAKINVMASAVTHDPRVAPSVSAHFQAKYAGLQRYLNGGRLIDLEAGLRSFYRMLERGETLVVLADAPVLPRGASLEVDFLGARRRLAGGAVRLAQRTGSDLGAFVCRRTGHRRYRVRLSAIGPAGESCSVDAAYGFLSQAILDEPGLWWAADLLPDMPVVAPAATTDSTCAPHDEGVLASTSSAPDLANASASGPLRPYQALLLTDSDVAGSAELAFGIAQVEASLRAGTPPGRWIAASRAAAPRPASLLAQLDGARLLVVLEPALLLAPGLPGALDEALRDGAACAVATTQHGAAPMPAAYVTRADFDAYVQARGVLPVSAPWTGSLLERPCAYMIDASALARLEPGDDDWAQLPLRLGARTVRAPRAYVHVWADYRRHERSEMLDLVPPDARRLLDVGGGEGRFVRAFQRRPGVDGWVLEPDAAAASRAREAGLQVLECRLQDIGTDLDAGFDVVTMLDVLEHFEDPLQALLAVRRLLRPGGALVVSTPNLGHWPIVRDLALGRFDYTPVGSLCWTHLRFFTERSLVALLGASGFTVDPIVDEGLLDDDAMERFVGACAAAGLQVDRRSLRTAALRVRARVG